MNTYSIVEKIIIDLPEPYADINYYQRPSQWELIRHRHPFFQFIYIVDGTLIIETQKKYMLQPGDLCIIPPDIAHALYTPEGYTQLGFNLQEKADSKKIIPMLEENICRFTILNQPNPFISFQSLNGIFAHVSYIQKLRLTNVCDDMLISCLELTETSDDSNFKMRLLNYLNSHIDTKIYLDDIAKFMAVSQTQLERLTNRHFGCSAIELFHKLKIQRACALLIDGQENIKEIAAKLGFEDPAYFSRFFKNKMGTTPSKYREKHLFL